MCRRVSLENPGRWLLAAGRLTSLLLWIITAYLFGVAVKAMTGSWAFGIAAQVLSFSMLSTLVIEPMHPGALLCALVAALLTNVVWLRPRMPAVSDALTGAAAAALLLTKVNVGLFALVALVFAVSQLARQRWWQWMGAAVLLAFGPALLLANGHEPWRLLWSAVYVTGTASVIIASRLYDDGDRGPRNFGLRQMATGFGVVATITVATTIATGTHVTSLIRGAFLRPLDHPHLVTIPLQLPTAAWAWLLVIPVALVLAHRWPTSTPSRRTIAISGGCRVAGGLALMIAVLGPLPHIFLMYQAADTRFAMLPLAALVLIPRLSPTAPTTDVLGRRFLAAFAFTTSLHAYPAPGSQVSWSLVVAGIAGVVTIADGVAELNSLAPNRAYERWAAFAGAMTCVVVVLVIPYGLRHPNPGPGGQFRGWQAAYARQRPLDLPGTGWIRPPGTQRGVILKTLPVLRRECSDIITLTPSLEWYVLADRRPPTGFNQPNWPAYLDDREQRAVIAALRRSPRVCLVLDPFTAGFSNGRVFTHSRFEPRRLVGYLEARRWALLSRAGDVTVLRALR